MDLFANPIIPSAPANDSGQMEIYGFNHEIVCPRDAASGLATGKRQHKAFTIRPASS